MNKKNIVIIGLGGVGGYFGFKMAQCNELEKQYNITFVVRGETYKAVQENGLQLFSPEHQNNVTRPDDLLQNISEIKHPHLIFICVKEYDLENVCRQLAGVITPQTILFPLMNGVDIYERIRTIIPHNVVLPSCVYVASHIRERGVVEHKGNRGRIVFGNDPEHSTEDIGWVADVLSSSQIDYSVKDSALVDIWTKFIFIASFGLVTAKYNSAIDVVCSDPIQREEARAIMKEIKEVGDKKGIGLTDDIIEKTFERAETFPKGTPTSLQLDIHSGKKHSELELFAGAILNYGAAFGVDCPNTQRIYDELKAARTAANKQQQ